MAEIKTLRLYPEYHFRNRYSDYAGQAENPRTAERIRGKLKRKSRQRCGEMQNHQRCYARNRREQQRFYEFFGRDCIAQHNQHGDRT